MTANYKWQRSGFHRGRTVRALDRARGPAGLRKQVEKGVDVEAFFSDAPAMNPNRSLIKGAVCGIRVEDVEDPLMRKIRYLDKLVDELAKGKPMEKILRS